MLIDTAKEGTGPGWRNATPGGPAPPQPAPRLRLKRSRGRADIDWVSVRDRDPQPALAHAPRGARRETWVWLAFVAGAALALLWSRSWDVRISDYGTEAAPSFIALLHGNFSFFLAAAPSYGASLILRAPFALPGSLAGGGALLIYRLGALPCLLALGSLGVWLARDLRRAGGGLLGASAAVVLCAANPITYRVLQIGHPEELLGAALCVVAVLLAQRGRAPWAGLALGLAIANKQWALLAVGPVLVALPAGRWRALALAALVASALVATLALASGTFQAAATRLVVADTGNIFTPFQAFWFLGAHGHWIPAMAPSIPKGYRLPPAWLGGRAHLLIVWLGLPLSVLALRRRIRPPDALAFLALLLLLRCWLDPWDNVYYPLPFIVALLAWETSVARRAPFAAAAATAATVMIFWYLPQHFGVDAQALSFLVPSTLTLATLATVVYGLRPRRGERAAPALLSRAPAIPW
jgi:hypothetical protein